MKTPTLRELLSSIGVGQFNATGIIPFMFMAPASTDARQPSILMLVRHLQRILYSMGATNLAESGFLDRMTADYLGQIVGPGWLNMSWAQVTSAVANARKAGVRVAPAQAGVEDFAPEPVAVGGVLDFLPDVPGGLLTYAVGAGALYYFLKKKH